jgi:protein-tyrosine phosphatase
MFGRIICLVLATVVTGSMLAGAEVTELSCIQTAPAEYNLSYSLADGTREVQIFASTDSAGAKGLQPIVKTSDTSVTVHAGEAGDREYFFLKPDHGKQREVSVRRLPLEGSPNFRDLGGYETTDGRFVRWGLIYRSGALNKLTPKDFAYLSQLGIHAVCDFRTQQENSTAPELWVPGSNVDHISLPIPPRVNKDANTSPQAFYASNPTLTELRDWMAINYDSLAFSAAPQYSKLFVQLEEEHLPLLYHCASGKDRTGVFSAFLLLMLGVPEKTVLADYELSNTYLKIPLPTDATKDASQKAASATTPAHGQLTQEQWQVTMVSDPEYLKGMLRHIEARYGSFDNYRRIVLAVSDEDVEKLRSRLLER